MPKYSKYFQIFFKISIGFQRIPKDSKGFQRIPKDSKGIQKTGRIKDLEAPALLGRLKTFKLSNALLLSAFGFQGLSSCNRYNYSGVDQCSKLQLWLNEKFFNSNLGWTPLKKDNMY